MKNNENGRSMVEMIAVLAVIGILTIGGMAGFNKAMNKMAVNKITHIIGEISTEAQVTNACVYAGADEDFEIPECVASITGFKNGQVMVVFKEDCTEIENAVGSSFAICKWDKMTTARTYYYVPNRGSECDEDGCDEGYTCDSYKPFKVDENC